MLRDEVGSATLVSPKKLFDGVRFVLFGFDSVSESQYRSELMIGGGIDVGRYDSSCTHVIVSGRVFDDAVCVVARNDRKVLVTELWIDDSLNIGMLADTTKVLYRPVRDLNGIPGSESLHICLTGYQRQERDDIMKMVSLMGGRFSKPLIANQVTHLICYKFEGEKYELAKKVNIKLVNHHWLGDCLKAWEILPIDNYTKSGWELEVLEAKAMDSEEENEGDGSKVAQTSNLRPEVPVQVASDVSVDDTRNLSLLKNTAPTKSPSPSSNNQSFSTPCRENSFQKGTNFFNGNSKLQGRTAEHFRDDHGAAGDIFSNQLNTSDNVDLSRKCNEFPSDASKSLISMSSREDDKKLSLSGFTRKDPERVVSPEEQPNKSPPRGGKLAVTKLSRNSEISSTKPKNASVKQGTSDDLCTPSSDMNKSNMEGKTDALPQKRKLSVSSMNSKLLKSGQVSRRSSLMNSPSICSAQPNSMGQRDVELDNMPLRNDCDASASKVAGQSDAFPHKQKLCISKETAGLALQNSSTCTKRSPSTNVVVPHKETDIGFTAVGDLPVNQHGAASKARCLSYKRKSLKDWHSSSSANTSNDSTLVSNQKDELSSNGFPSKPALDVETSAGVDALFSISSLDGKLHSDCPMVNGTGQVMDTSPERLANFPSSSLASDVAAGNGAPNGSMETEAAVKFETRNGVSLKCKLDVSSETSDGHDKPLDDPEVLPSDLGEKTVKASGAGIPGAFKHQKSKEVLIHRNVPASKKVCCNPKKGNSTKERSSNPHATIQLTKTASDSVACSLSPSLNKDCCYKIRKGCLSLQGAAISSRRDAVHSSPSSSSLIDVVPEPVWFMLSGPRVQRKEFQSIIKMLGGRVCRDSHQWSYQATHFVVPDPVRRTEKFFAAAASGRWILRSDYLTACSEAGKFLDEEPYEWHRNGLTADGAISLEGPRKWRALRERTGHGAFHGMRIIIYGECIAPPLDTLKRAVKAGDGTILATSPPYNRFLNSGVDFAVVATSMPRVDAWVQEFLRHEIPCVLADYLVEYVCKPGYSLEKHVLYSTHKWAERSFADLLARSEEVVPEDSPATPATGCSDDLACAVCGSQDRGDVMLICGDEAGTLGCGTGTHIDCCDPPLETVPANDWFCPSCSKSLGPKSPARSTKAMPRRRK